MKNNKCVPVCALHIRHTKRHLKQYRMTLVVLNETQESVVSVKNQTQREDVHTVTNVAAVNIGCWKRKDTTASTCKIEVSSVKLNHATVLLSQSPLSKKQEKTAELVGCKNLVHCNLGGVMTTVLWDSGSQVSMVDTDWKKKHTRC